MELSHPHDLYVLPFDHRGSFEKKLLGIRGRPPTEEEAREIASYKEIIYEGFKKALASGVPEKKAAILVDEQFGAEILRDAKARGFTTACPVEKSGQEEFQFEYGPEFGAHIAKFNPTFAKVLVRYNPEGDAALNRRQAERLRQLSDYCQAHGNRLMFELLVPATREQLSRLGGDPRRYDRELRPSLMVKAMRELRNSGIEPAVWKVEGMESAEDCRRVVAQARAQGHPNAGVIVLGRGENSEKVTHWLEVGAKVPGMIGFAVGRTVFWEPLQGVKQGRLDRETAAEQVARGYRSLCELWARAGAEASRGAFEGVT